MVDAVMSAAAGGCHRAFPSHDTGFAQTAAINLCVPDELHLRKDDATGENWFAITEQALESHLERLAASASASGRTSTRAYGQRGSHTSEEASAAR